VVEAHPVTHQARKPASAHQQRIGAFWPQPSLAGKGQRDRGVNLATVGFAWQPFERRGSAGDGDGPAPQHPRDLGLRFETDGKDARRLVATTLAPAATGLQRSGFVKEAMVAPTPKRKLLHQFGRHRVGTFARRQVPEKRSLEGKTSWHSRKDLLHGMRGLSQVGHVQG
jgi:hypothetical protein